MHLTEAVPQIVVVEEDVAFRPFGAGLLSAKAAVLQADSGAEEVKKTRFLGGGSGGVFACVARVPCSALS